MAFRNYLINPEWEVRDNGDLIQVTAGGADGPNKWRIGPGAGGAVKATFPLFDFAQVTVPGYPERNMRLEWTQAPTSGEPQYAPEFRWTFLEHHIVASRELMGKLASYRVYLRIESGQVNVKPIFWINYQDGSYWILQDQPIVTVGSAWQLLAGVQSIPPVPVGQPLDATHYVGWGLDFVYQTMPAICIAKPAVWLGTEDAVENRPIALERMLARA